MEVLLGFLTVIAAQLLRMTYLDRTQPEAPASIVLRPVQLEVLKAKSSRHLHLPKALTVAWAIQAVARLGGYLGQDAKISHWHSGFMAWLVAVRIFVIGLAAVVQV